jgi:hypothetical protein
VAHGPVLEVSSRDQHRKRRDKTAALEKALAEAMCAGGYDVLGTVNCRVPLDEEMFAEVLEGVFSVEHVGQLIGVLRQVRERASAT